MRSRGPNDLPRRDNKLSYCSYGSHLTYLMAMMDRLAYLFELAADIGDKVPSLNASGHLLEVLLQFPDLASSISE